MIKTQSIETGFKALEKQKLITPAQEWEVLRKEFNMKTICLKYLNKAVLK